MDNNFGVEIEFFDPIRDSPEDGEMVLIVLKPDNSISKYHTIHGVKVDEAGRAIICAEAKLYKTVPTKFSFKKYYTYTFSTDDIVCWGRIK